SAHLVRPPRTRQILPGESGEIELTLPGVMRFLEREERGVRARVVRAEQIRVLELEVAVSSSPFYFRPGFELAEQVRGWQETSVRSHWVRTAHTSDPA